MIKYIAFCKVKVNSMSSLLGSCVDIFPYMGTQCLKYIPIYKVYRWYCLRQGSYSKSNVHTFMQDC